MDHLIPPIKADQEIINKKNLPSSGLCHSSGPQNENKSEKIDKYLNLTRELKKLRNIRVTVIPIVVDALRMAPKDIEK